MKTGSSRYKDELLVRKGVIVGVTFVLLVFSIEFTFQKIFLWETMHTSKVAIETCSSITDLETSKYCFSSFIEKSNNKLLWNINSYIIGFLVILIFVSLQTIKRYYKSTMIKILRLKERLRRQ